MNLILFQSILTGKHLLYGCTGDGGQGTREAGIKRLVLKPLLNVDMECDLADGIVNDNVVDHVQCNAVAFGRKNVKEDMSKSTNKKDETMEVAIHALKSITIPKMEEIAKKVTNLCDKKNRQKVRQMHYN